MIIQEDAISNALDSIRMRKDMVERVSREDTILLIRLPTAHNQYKLVASPVMYHYNTLRKFELPRE